MLQRIQSIYLFLAAIASALTIFLPLARFCDGRIIAMLYSYPSDISSPLIYSLLIFSIFAVVIAFIAIFGYKNRKRQMKWCNSLIMASVFFYICYAFICYKVVSGGSFTYRPTIWVALPFISIILAYLGKRGIKHDEEKVRAADRIR